MNQLQTLKNLVFTEPSSKAVRPHLLELIRFQINRAHLLSNQELLHGEGANIAAVICGAIAWNSADEGVEHDGWLNANDEPLLFDILNVSGSLDADGNDKEKWIQLFELVERLK